MDHMPYESMEVGGTEPGAGPSRKAPSEATPEESPGRTPRTAEAGGDEQEGHRMPHGEPGKTPGSAEGEDPARPNRK